MNITLRSTKTLLLAAFTAGTFMAQNAYAFVKLDQTQSNALKIEISAANGKTAQSFVSNMGDKAVGFLSDKSLSQSQKEKAFDKLLNKHFDMNTIGRFAAGKNWRTATAAQKSEYQKLFKNMIVRVYAGRFSDYNGEDFDVAGFKDSGKKDVVVTSYIIPNGGSKVQVDWRVRNKGGNYQIIDVIIEGVSMSLTQRSDFSSVIQRGGGKFEVLLDHLRK